MQTLHKWNRLQLHGLHITLPSTAYDYFPKLKKEILEKKQDTFYLKLLLYTYIYVILNNF